MVRVASAALAVAVVMAASSPCLAQKGHVEDQSGHPHAIGEELLLAVNEPWHGDLDGIRQRRLLRVLTVYNHSDFFISSGAGKGLEYEALSRFAAWLADPKTPDALRGGTAEAIRAVFVPVPFQDLIPVLVDGRGDVIAAGMTATEERASNVAFSQPYVTKISEVVVRNKDAPPLASVDDLSGRVVLVQRGSSHAAGLRALGQRLEAAGRAPPRIVEAPAMFAAEDILPLVNGAARNAVADSHVADLWHRMMPDMVIEHDAALVSGTNIAWAVRQDAPALKAALDAYASVLMHERATIATLIRRYFAQTTFIANPFAEAERDRVRAPAPHFRTVSDQVGFAWLLMVAQGFQESRLDPNARSSVGAVGIMQLMPATGAEMGVRDLHDAGQNIHGGVRYMEKIRRVYFNDPAIPPEVQVQFALAAYNAGPNRINHLRDEAAQQGLDRNQWFGHVERVTQQRVGSETVRYVANIYAYYATYAMAEDLLADRHDELAHVSETLAGR